MHSCTILRDSCSCDKLGGILFSLTLDQIYHVAKNLHGSETFKLIAKWLFNLQSSNIPVDIIEFLFPFVFAVGYLKTTATGNSILRVNGLHRFNRALFIQVLKKYHRFW